MVRLLLQQVDTNYNDFLYTLVLSSFGYIGLYYSLFVYTVTLLVTSLFSKVEFMSVLLCIMDRVIFRGEHTVDSDITIHTPIMTEDDILLI